MNFTEIIQNRLNTNFTEINFEFSEYRNEIAVKLDKNFIKPVCKFLKTDPELEFLLCEDITAVDWAERKNRFTVVYHVFSFKNNLRIVLKADVDESDCKIDS